MGQESSTLQNRMDFRIVIAIALAFLMLMGATLPGLTRAQTAVVEESAYTTHDPIRINGNADFATQATAEGWPGDGSEGNPYVIEGYEINGTGHGYCIYIGNTTVYFVVRGCYVHNASENRYYEYYRDAGVYLWNVQNGRLENNTIIYNESGIRLYHSSHNFISDNTIFSNKHNGIFIYWQCENNIISDNNLTNNVHAIIISDSTDNYIKNNDMWGNAIHLDGGTKLELLDSHDIDSSNTVNGKPVYYLKNVNGEIVPEDAGQVILVNCKGVTVQNLNISNVDFGISLFFSSENMVTNNILYTRQSGIRLSYSDGNTIANNSIHNTANASNGIGIILLASYQNTVIDNNITGFSKGIEVTVVSSHSEPRINNNVVQNNTFSDNEMDYDVELILESGGINMTLIYLSGFFIILAIIAFGFRVWKEKKNIRKGE